MIAILGGGVAGAAVAWGLGRAGRRDVVVFDPRQPGLGSTGKALGGFRTQHGSALNINLSVASRDFFVSRAELIGFRPNGYLYLAEDEATAQELRERAILQTELGLPIEHPVPAEKVPFLQAADVLGTNFCRLDGLYSPPQILETFIAEARDLGVDFRYGCEASEVELDGAAAIVVAAGIWSRPVGAALGVRLEVDAAERGVFWVGPFDWLDEGLPMTLEAGSGYHFREREGRLVIMGPGDQHDWQHFREWLARRVPRAAVERPERHWTGNYELTFDHHALVGRTERDRVWACCGFSGHGVMQAPTVGACLAAMILGDSPAMDISALSPLRREGLLDRTQL